jgi:AraC-like DNA-binding protein
METYREKAVYAWSEDSIRLINTPSVTAKSTYFYVEEAGYFKTKSQYYTERENLNSYLIVFTVSGKGYLNYKGNSYTILPNQAFFINCMDYQYYETDEENFWEILWVHFNGSASHGYYEEFAKSGSPVVSFDENSPISSIIKDLITTNQQKDIRAEIISSKLIMNLLTEMLLSTNIQANSSAFAPDFIKSSMKYMDKYFNEEFTLDDLAEKYSISKFHFAKEFRKYTGFSPNEYKINSRINYSKELLKYSHYSISEIALKVGIENISHFINLFKDREEMTPLAYRKKWQNPKY